MLNPPSPAGFGRTSLGGIPRSLLRNFEFRACSGVHTFDFKKIREKIRYHIKKRNSREPEEMASTGTKKNKTKKEKKC
ncbi:MAG: hypothetical protein HYW78_01385 [Parcubacteria group bacterium]|nr:hypothetical protein [Parcubacteria group bacterium]